MLIRLSYHLAHMFSRIGYPTIAVDLDPQANLTSAFLDEGQLEDLWGNGKNISPVPYKPAPCKLHVRCTNFG